MSTRVSLKAEARPEPMEPLHIKYRPKSLKEVVGQDATVRSLQSMLLKEGHNHVYLFTGPAGTGKTTLARILATEFDCGLESMIEVDAASNSGIDDMRQITSALRYQGFGKHSNKAIILNECQGLSKQAWDSLLDSTEQPPPHVYFFFTSTNPEKIPKAMLTRCASYHLNALKYDDIMDVLEEVVKLENMDPLAGTLGQVADACEGSLRHALTMLAKVWDCDTANDVAELLRTPLDNTEVIELCRMLIKGDLGWKRLQETLKGLEEMSAESIRIIITNYLVKCAWGARGEKEAMHIVDMLEVFGKPCNPTDKMAPILIAFGRYIWA